MTYDSCFQRLGALVCLALACGGGSGDDTTTATTGTSADSGAVTTSSTSTDPAPTTGSPGETGTSSAATSDATTAGPTATSDATTAGPTSASTSDATTGADQTTSGSSGATSEATSGGLEPAMRFFVSSTGSPTGNLGGLVGADQRCQDLADAVGAGDKEWRAYLSIEKGLDDGPVHARDRIGAGPWHNAAGVLVAADLEELHARDGDADVFLDEHGEKVPGQWEGSPDPNAHDILTGTLPDGTVAVGKTCEDWNSEDPALFAIVGHSDGLGPNGSDDPMYRPWHSVHDSGGCHDTAPKGGAGRIYCFAVD